MATGTQVEELEVAKRAYADKQYGKMEEAQTGLLPELLRLCLDLLQSFPELTVITTGRPMAWLANRILLPTDCMKYDLQMQCHVCTKTTLASLVPQMTDSMQKKKEAEKREVSSFLVSCPDCAVKCRDNEKYRMYWCKVCNFLCIETRSDPQSVSTVPTCLDGTLHSFIESLCSL
jgi:hypothetical protein